MRINLKFSYLLLILMSLLHGGSVILFIFLPVPWSVKLVCCLMCAMSYGSYWRIYHHGKLDSIRFNEKGALSLHTCNKTLDDVTLLLSTFIGEWFMVLHVCESESGKKYRYLLLKDNFDSEYERRALARWCGQYFMMEI